MLVTCSHCSTTYNLPDDKAKIGAKLRCTVCKNVFKLEPPEDDKTDYSEDLEDFDFPSKKAAKKKSGGKLKKILIFLIILGIMAGGVFAILKYTNLLDGVTSFMENDAETGLSSPTGNGEDSEVEQVRLMELRNVRQYTINNEKIGKISVIEGRIINGFNSPRELVKVEGTLYNPSGKALISKTQLAGTSVSLFQLQVLGKEELEQALANNIDIAANNSNIQPEGIVPFMLIFYNPPQEASEFGVRVIDAKAVNTGSSVSLEGEE